MTYAAFESATCRYERFLAEHPDRLRVLDELGEIGVRNSEVTVFRLGYAPAQGPTPMADDRFGDRLIIPIMDLHGRPVAFRARRVDRGQRAGSPLYVSTPETSMFSRTTTIFGLWQAQAGIRSRNRVVLVESHEDVLALHSHGYTNVVGAMARVITPEQARLLRQYTSNVTFLFGADAHGQRSAVLGEGECLRARMNVTVRLMTHGMSGSDFIRAASETTRDALFGVRRPN